ncbi:Syd protein [Streptomyces sp. NBRC 110611]|uniref:hypothetical protein n=1 Tax=Streptomyces sp. NBRC 110611 TaxID=1621259 RepID=UPI000837759B|nr:hypothetical protein [Streptomyces sp. NBRC 110611]GAU70708.1 Syd protein [Streptomyces sp. NBRC 110611]
MSLVYCQRWNNRFNKPIKPLSAEEARQRHEAGEPYAVASFDEAHGRADRSAEIALRSGHVRVFFYDDLSRVEMTYTFAPQDELLFLSEIVTYDYGDTVEYRGMSQCQRMEKDEFRPDGTGDHSVEEEVTGERYTEELTLIPGRTLDDLWERVPQFGTYDSITRGSRKENPIPFA